LSGTFKPGAGTWVVKQRGGGQIVSARAGSSARKTIAVAAAMKRFTRGYSVWPRPVPARDLAQRLHDLRQRPVQIVLPVWPAVLPGTVEAVGVPDARQRQRAHEADVHLEYSVLQEVAAGVARVVVGSARQPIAAREEKLGVHEARNQIGWVVRLPVR